MVEPSGHCPYLGLKQNRAIRFASPTPEHRCFVGGEPIEIPVDQATFCLSPGHVQCPLYMGLSFPTTSEAELPPVEPAIVVPAHGLRGWLLTLSLRDRLVYATMLGLLAVIIAIYLVLGARSLLNQQGGIAPTTLPIPSPSVGSVGTLPTVMPSDTPSTPTRLPTRRPTATPTEAPTDLPIILPPTRQPTATLTGPGSTPQPTSPIGVTPPVTAPSSTPISPINVTPPVTAPSSTPQPTSPIGVTPPVVAPSMPPPIAQGGRTPTTSRPSPTFVPAPPLPPTPAPTQTSPANVTNLVLILYFADSTGTLYVPVQRTVPVENKQVATAAVHALIDGPRNGLGRLVLSDVKLLSLTIDNGTATVNFDRRPTSQGDVRGLYAITLTLTHFPSIQRVQIQVNGQNIGINGSGPIARPVVNPLNPQHLPTNVSTTEFLPLYFLSANGRHDIRVIRMVPKTRQTAEGTVRALLEGPGDYAYALQRVIPEGTELRGIRLDQGTITVDFTQPFANAQNRRAAVRTLVESLTTLRTVQGVQILVEGRSLAEQWGSEYGVVFNAPPINPE